MKKLIVVGAGGFGYEVIWVAEEMNAQSPAAPLWEILGYVDDNPEKAGRTSFGYRVLGRAEDVAGCCPNAEIWYHCALGDNLVRRRVSERLDRLGWRAATLVHPSAIRAMGVPIGEGTYVGALSILTPECRIGRHVIINQRVAIGHESVVEDFAQVCSGAQVNGGCRIGVGALIGSNASLYQGTTVGANAMVGSNSLLVKSAPDGVSVMGVPARAFYVASSESPGK